MQRFRADVGVPPEHFPILVTGDQRDLLDFKSGLKEPAGAFMAQVVEVQVLNPEVLYRSGEHRAGGLVIIGEDAVIFVSPDRALLLD